LGAVKLSFIALPMVGVAFVSCSYSLRWPQGTALPHLSRLGSGGEFFSITVSICDRQVLWRKQRND
jgi:hypothetical protein